MGYSSEWNMDEGGGMVQMVCVCVCGGGGGGGSVSSMYRVGGSRGRGVSREGGWSWSRRVD